MLVNALTKLDYDEWLRRTPQPLLSSFLSSAAASPEPRQAPPPRTATASEDDDVQRVLNLLVDRMSSLGLASFSEQVRPESMSQAGRWWGEAGLLVVVRRGRASRSPPVSDVSAPSPRWCLSMLAHMGRAWRP